MHTRHLILSVAVLGLLLSGCPKESQPGPRTGPRGGAGGQGGGGANAPTLIPRQLLFGNPKQTSPKISPDGTRLAYLAPDKGVRNVWVKTIGKDDARAVSSDRYRGVSRYFWGKAGQRIFYLQDKGGDENYRIHQVELKSGKTKILTPESGVRAGIVKVSKHHPDRILITLNKRRKSLFDVYALHLKTGNLELVAENPGRVMGWLPDHDLQVRAALRTTTDGGLELLARRALQRMKRRSVGQKAKWVSIQKWGPLDGGRPVTWSKDGQHLYVVSNLGSDTHRLVRLRPFAAGAKPEVIHADAKADLGRFIMVNPDDYKIEAVGIDYLRLRWKVLDPRVETDFDRLRKLAGRDSFHVISRSNDDKKWVIVVTGPRLPGRHYLYDRTSGKTTFLFDQQPGLNKFKLAQVEARVLTARDGLKIPTYLTFPNGAARKNLPTVMFVHGGPWGRDRMRYHSYAQWLANRGYLVIQPNFRGSAGFGKAFLNAGNKEWGRKMQHDVTDAAKWAVKEGLADPKRIGIMGGSYGGYATLAGVCFTPKLYAVAVDIVGPSSIITLLKAIPPYWKPMQDLFRVRVGDIVKEKKMLMERSPLHHVDKIVTPLFIFQGKNDPRVKIGESDQIVQAIRKRGGKVSYVVYPDEGHGFRRPANRIDFVGRTEPFLAKYLGGKVQPYAPIKGTTAQVR